MIKNYSIILQKVCCLYKNKISRQKVASSPTPGTITILASLTEPHQGATKQKRLNMAHLLLNRRKDEQRMDKSRIRLETLDDTIRRA